MPFPVDCLTRRRFLAAAALPLFAAAPSALSIPVHHVVDGRRRWSRRQLDWYWRRLWPQAAADLAKCGIRIESSRAMGEVWRPAERQPDIEGLIPGALNIVLTHSIPMFWDRGRAISGLTARYRGVHLCMIALNRAHLHEAPFLSVNTCLHELLHALLGDIFEERPAGFAGELRELRIDWYATRLWLLGDGRAIHDAAQRYLERLRPARAAQI
jgi:hypothetical protein